MMFVVLVVVGFLVLFGLVLRDLDKKKRKTKPEDWQVREFPNLSLGEGGLIVEYTCDHLPLSLFAVQSRRFLLYVPEQFQTSKGEKILQDKKQKIPLVVIFHSPKYTAYTFYKRSFNSQGKTWQEMANEKGFVIVFAEAMRRSCRDTPTNLPLWVFDEYDETYIQSSLEFLFQENPALDRKKTYGIGYSSRTKRDLGALFSASLGIQMDNFAAVAHYEGTLLSSKLEMSNIPRAHTKSSLRQPLENPKKGIKTPLFFIVSSSKNGKEGEEGEGEGRGQGEREDEGGQIRCANVIKFLKGEGWPLLVKSLPSMVREMRDHHSSSPSSMHVELIWGFFNKDHKKRD